MFKNFWKLLFLLITNQTLAVNLDTISIKGDIELSPTNLSGNFIYSIRNNSDYIQPEWNFFIHPNVDILAVAQNNTQAKTIIKQELGYQIISIKLPQAIKPEGRSVISIRLSIKSQTNNSRFFISSNDVFLDARSFWFPIPIKDVKVNFTFNVKHSSNLTSIMGGKKIDSIDNFGKTISTWKNELQDLSPSASLIITKKPLTQENNIYIYSDNTNFKQTIFQDFIPYWNIAMTNYQRFPLSEIHIVPIKNLHIPYNTNHIIEGEFLGNIFLIDQSIIDGLTVPYNYDTWDTPSERLLETLIHEFHHSFFPGITKHDSDNLLFTESLVQYLSWGLISSVNPTWSKKIALRTRFYLQNFELQKQHNDIWKFLWDQATLYGATKAAQLDNFTLTDILIEKYQFIKYTPYDVLDTIFQYQYQQYYLQEDKSTNPLDITFIKTLKDKALKKEFFDTQLKVKKTNFSVMITNTTLMKKKQIASIPVVATFISLSNNYPFTWIGDLSWIENNMTNTIPISIKQNNIWETNLLGEIELIYTHSPFDILEKNLNNNYISKNNLGRAIIYNLNNHREELGTAKIILSPDANQKLIQLQQQKHTLVWDSTVHFTDNIMYINAFVDQKKQQKHFISLPIKVEKNQYTILNIINK